MAESIALIKNVRAQMREDNILAKTDTALHTHLIKCIT